MVLDNLKMDKRIISKGINGEIWIISKWIISKWIKCPDPAEPILRAIERIHRNSQIWQPFYVSNEFTCASVLLETLSATLFSLPRHIFADWSLRYTIHVHNTWIPAAALRCDSCEKTVTFMIVTKQAIRRSESVIDYPRTSHSALGTNSCGTEPVLGSENAHRSSKSRVISTFCFWSFCNVLNQFPNTSRAIDERFSLSPGL